MSALRTLIALMLLIAPFVPGCGAGTTSPRASTPPSTAQPTTTGVSARAADLDDSRREFTTAATHHDPATFTGAARRYLEQRDREARVRVTEPLVLVMDRGEGSVQISLERPWEACQADARECEDATRSYLDAVLTTTRRSAADRAATPERLRLAVRNRALVAQYGQLGEIVASPLVADLVAVVMLDFPESARVLRRDELPSLGLDEAAAVSRAKRNVLEELGPLRERRAPSPGVIVTFGEQQFYGASFLLDLEGWTALEQRTGSPLLVLAVTNDLVLVAHPSDPTAATVLRAIGDEVARRGAPILSRTVLRFTGGRFEVVE